MKELNMKGKDSAEKAFLVAMAAVVVVIVVVSFSFTVFTGSEAVTGDDGGSVLTGGGTTAAGGAAVPGGGQSNQGGPGTGRTSNAGITMEEYERARASGPGPGAENPSLPSGEQETHKGTALMTAVVGGQTFKIEVAVTIKLDGTGRFDFAYAGTGTVPVNLGGNVAATADYKVAGAFTGTVSDGAFTGNGPAVVEATVNVPGMAPQSGGSTQQLTITGTMHDAGNGTLEGDFSGGSYLGTFRAVKS